MTRGVALCLYALLVLIWSSTWVAIKIGLEDSPALLGAGVRFTAAGVVLLAFAAARRRPLRTDMVLAGVLGLLPFAAAYGLVYWGEQYIPSGLTAVLFGIMPLYTALLGALLLADEPLAPRLLAGVVIAIAGLALAFAESLELGDGDAALGGAIAVVLSPLGSAAGNVAIKRRGHELDAVVLNGWAMLAGGLLLLGGSAVSEDWGQAAWTARAISSIAYLAVIGSAVAFVGLTVLLRRLSAQAVSFIALLIPFGALAFGAALYDEAITARAVAGAALVVAGLVVAQAPARRRVAPEPARATG
ncbi:MAG TPA: EamA family transporter [Solirubrobacteraceae bacterium]|nr:EamA family transporter [Solirubrobacteraceae bacterium]